MDSERTSLSYAERFLKMVRKSGRKSRIGEGMTESKVGYGWLV